MNLPSADDTELCGQCGFVWDEIELEAIGDRLRISAGQQHAPCDGWQPKHSTKSNTTSLMSSNLQLDRPVADSDIGATRISQLIVRPTAESMLESITSTGDMDLPALGLEFDEIELQNDSPLTNRLIGDLEVRGAYSYLIIGIRMISGDVIMHPTAEVRLSAGDRLIVLGYQDDIPSLGSKAGATRTVTYRGTTSEL